jgi:hypothetical protein
MGPVIPWWLNPWRAALSLRHACAEQGRIISNQARTVHQVRDENRDLKAQIYRMQHPPAVSAGSALALGSSIKPEFVLAGFTRGAAGVRLIASRNLDGTDLTMTGMSDPPPRWALHAKLGNALIIDKPDYGSAIAEMARIWRNWEAEDRKGVEQRKAIGS